MRLIRLLDDIATDLEQQVGKIRDAATAASEVEDSADEQAAAVNARLVALGVIIKLLTKQLEVRIDG
jgi:hypothetical protein